MAPSLAWSLAPLPPHPCSQPVPDVPTCLPQPAAHPSIASPPLRRRTGAENPIPSSPNSLLFDPAGDKAFMGSDFGALMINPTNFGTNNNPFTGLGTVTGKVLADLQQRKHCGLLRHHAHSESGLRRQHRQCEFAVSQRAEYLSSRGGRVLARRIEDISSSETVAARFMSTPRCKPCRDRLLLPDRPTRHRLLPEWRVRLCSRVFDGQHFCQPQRIFHLQQSGGRQFESGTGQRAGPVTARETGTTSGCRARNDVKLQKATAGVEALGHGGAHPDLQRLGVPPARRAREDHDRDGARPAAWSRRSRTPGR